MKARLCVRGDQQTQGVNFFELYALVVQWMTVQLIFLLALIFNWEAILAEEVYMEMPWDFAAPNENDDFVLKLNKSLYGLCEAHYPGLHI